MSRRPPAVLAAVVAVIVGGCGGSSADRPPTGSSAAVQAANGPAAPATTAAARPPVHVAPSRAAVPVLMYHVIATAPPGARYAGLWVSPAAFATEVRALRAAGYDAVTLERVFDAWRGRATLPRRPVVLTFDDGYLSQGKAAASTLRAAGWPGVLNLVLHNLDTPGGLTTGRVRRMLADGWELGAHSLTHRDLTTLGAADLRREVAGSRAALRRRFGVPVRTFCYPAGRFDAAVERAVRAAGFRNATTEIPGAATRGGDPFALPRIRVTNADTGASVLARLRATVGSRS